MEQRSTGEYISLAHQLILARLMSREWLFVIWIDLIVMLRLSAAKSVCCHLFGS
jgi:hypothetical protein